MATPYKPREREIERERESKSSAAYGVALGLAARKRRRERLRSMAEGDRVGGAECESTLRARREEMERQSE